MEEHASLFSPGVHELFELINLLVLVTIGVIFGRKGILGAFKNRSQKIHDDLISAREELKKISQEIAMARKNLSEIDAERAKLLRQVEEEGKVLAKRMVEEAQASAVRIREDAARAVAAEFTEMQGKLKAELVDALVAKVQTEFEGEGSRQKLHEKLIEGFLEQQQRPS